jgi:predicted MFS family arabinose efflux permease
MQKRYKLYLLLLLMVILTFNYVDRVALGVVLEDIKRTFDLSDTQLGLLGGIAFTLFYALLGIPIARWADRGDRVMIITLTTALWSVTVALCGVATSFLQLMLIRVSVAVGEAGCIPPAHSLIASYFSREERPWAVSIYMLGNSLCLAIGYFAAGWLNQLYGWRATFVILGLPGLLLAALAGWSLKEPRRTHRSTSTQKDGIAPEGTAIEAAPAPSLMEVCRALWANKTFVHLLVCFSVWYFFGYGLLQWMPTFFIRSHGLTTGVLGTWFALIFGLGGGLGTYLGGAWANRYAAGNERLQLVTCALAFMLYAVLNIGAFLARNSVTAFVVLAIANIGGNISLGPMLATIQTLVAPRMRAMSIALVYLFANLIGMGLGPLAVGVLSDELRPSLGAESLRYALVALCPGYFWAAWHLWRASRTVARDIKTSEDDITVSAEADSMLVTGL